MTEFGDIMTRTAYATLLAMFRLLALLSLKALYILGDLTFALMYRLVRYRRKVVADNLKKCFPDKPEKELKAIEKQFYRNFSDYIFETVKLLHISNSEMKRRMTFGNFAAIDDALTSGRDVVVYFSHCGNWEWATDAPLFSRYSDDGNVVFGQIYRPLRNKVMDRLMQKIRSRFDTCGIAKSTALRRFVQFRNESRRFVVGFMSDQKPSYGDRPCIVDFFGRPTAVITGTETVARRLGAAAVYWDMRKVSRGHYHIEVIPMTTDASQTGPGELTAGYYRLLQKTIERQPALWLWSHKRWKTSPSTWAQVNPETILK